MNFKKLELYGFKSFADKLEIFFDDGITAIVGPNGCGKSNVADAIRWVLGEQSARLLRGTHMQDVIFSGTSARKSLSYCEVNLHFDNSGGMFPLEYKEVVVSRKLYRDGTSEYAINKTPCRLKDVADILHDTGLGREGYSIIGQGRIDEILSAKPDDRRAIFEEAAGITKFKIRKLDAERKLTRTHDNLSRINDILTEVERQLAPLQKQAENARAFLDLKEKLKLFEVNTYLYQYDSASNSKSAINERLAGVTEELDAKNADYERTLETYTACMNELGELDALIGEARDEVLRLTVGLEKTAGEYRLLQEKLKFMREQNAKLSDENNALKQNLIRLETLLAQKEAEKIQKAAALAELKKRTEKVGDQYLALVDKLTVGEGEAEGAQKEIMAALERLTEVKSNLSRLTAEKAALTDRRADLDKRAENLNVRATDDEIKAILSGNEIEKLTAERDRLRAAAADTAAKHNENLALSAQNAKKHEQTYAQFISNSTRFKTLSELQANYEGFGNTLRLLLKDADKDSPLSSRIEGVVAKLISAPEKFEAAIEMALGGASQNVVTRTEGDAEFIIRYLKDKRYGRATFLPISGAKPRSIDPGFRKLLAAPGVFGVADELVRYDGKYERVIKGLLGGTVVTDTLDTAIALARASGYGFKIVTLDGDVIEPRGSITGGSRRAEAGGLLSREREIKTLSETIAAQKTELEKLLAAKAAAEKAGAELLAALKNYEADLHGREVALAGETEKRAKIQAGVADSKKEIDNLTAEKRMADNRAAEIESDIRSVDELEELVKAKRGAANLDMEKNRREFGALRLERDELHETLTGLKVGVAAAESEMSALSAEITRIGNDVAEAGARIAGNEAAIANNQATVDAADAAARERENAASSDVNEGKLNETRAGLSDLEARKIAAQEKLGGSDERRVSLMNELQRLTDRKYKEENLLAKVDTDIEILQNRVWEEYQLTYEGCAAYREENYNVSKGLTETNRLKKQIQNLGYVNVNAIEESRELAERHDSLAAQRDDLTRAEEDLHKIIYDLTADMVVKFKKSFEEIRANFTKTFQELFGGGRAELALAEGEDDLLEAGIEVVAEPPGKKLQSIGLLSGGERALTAIAILFAILRMRPMPFCVLDEIEAALDDANAERFAKYLRRFSEETQFIVITHRKPTMELADSLYGVTMEEKGVSKMVSVRLTEALKAAGQ
ncbi:MAG: chromosome segregation protein SMC [Clostridiales bacterium]|jgi:chromosome segregation protein|nr:chromosome segregation protein SMC [Clostridiales bacterium]